uniref:MIF4G domain-containing protein n=1 Tax=Strigamia maritima TaxID=126957 RepID=T1JG94_STRMM
MDDNLRPSPGLNMDHGFMRKIEQNQHIREQQSKDDVSKKLEIARMARKVGMPVRTTKPTMEIYRPPNLRGPESNSAPPFLAKNAGPLTPEAPLFIPTSSATTMQYFANDDRGSPHPDVKDKENVLESPKPNLRSTCAITPHVSKVHFQLQVPALNMAPKNSFGLKRSKSLGAGDLKTIIPKEFDLGGFGFEIQGIIKKAYEDPNKLASRHLMEAVRHIFNRVIENSRYAEPAARLAFSIIEKEKTETFLESTLNSCREFYNERNRFLRNISSMSGEGQPNNRWIAYVTFMYEIYTRLKTRQRSIHAGGASALIAGPMLLSLLAECCHIFLKPPSLYNFLEIECLFFILTSIGRDLENEMPHKMKQIMAAVRDAFTTPSIAPFVSKTLLQLIELQASNWQLTTPAVTYYYPGSQERK